MFVLLAMASASLSASWLEQLRLDLLAQRANQRARWLHRTLDDLPVDGEDRVCLLELCRTLQLSRYGDGGKLKKQPLIEKLSRTILEQLPVASAASAGSADVSMSSRYMSQVRAELRRQPPDVRAAWLKAEMDSMNLKSSHLGKPSVRDVCKYLNLAVSEQKEILVENLVEKLMSEIGHVVEAASASSGVAPAVVKRYVQILRVSLTQQEPHERSSWLQSQFKPLLHRRSKDGKPSVVDIAQFLKLSIAKPEGGWLHMPDLILDIIEKLIGDLPDSSAEASAPAMGFVVALSFF